MTLQSGALRRPAVLSPAPKFLAKVSFLLRGRRGRVATAVSPGGTTPPASAFCLAGRNLFSPRTCIERGGVSCYVLGRSSGKTGPPATTEHGFTPVRGGAIILPV